MNVTLSPASMMDEGIPQIMPNVGTYRVDFNGNTVGLFDVDDKGKYTWSVVDPQIAQAFPKSKFSDLPSTIHNLHPDLGMFGLLLHVKTKEEFIGTGIKCLSGIRVFPVLDKATGMIPERGARLDFKMSALNDHTSPDGTFSGIYGGPYGMAGRPEFNELLSQQWVGRFNHRFSGKQTKMPGHLNGHLLLPAVDSLSFTHFIKYPTVGGREADGLLEWAGLRAARDTGLKVNDFALLDQGPDLPPAIIVERFDIPRSPEDLKKDWVLMQDFYSIAGEDPLNDTRDRQPLLFRYDELMANWINYCNKHDPANTDKNARAFLTRLITSWASNDADLHAKNMSALIHIDPQTKTITSVELSPAYDVCPSTLSGRDGEPMFYNLNAKKGQHFESRPPRKLNMNDWMNFLKSPKLAIGGKPYGIFDTEDEAKKFVRDVTSKVAHSIVQSYLEVPHFVRVQKHAATLMMEMQHLAAISINRARSIGADVPDIDFDPGLKAAVEKYGAKARRDAYEKSGLSGIYQTVAAKAEEVGRSLQVTVGGVQMGALQAAYAPPRQ